MPRKRLAASQCTTPGNGTSPWPRPLARSYAAAGYGLTAPTDRLRLTPERVAAIAKGLKRWPHSPIRWARSSHVGAAQWPEVQKVRVPIGVIFFIYESRPNVTADGRAVRQER